MLCLLYAPHRTYVLKRGAVGSSGTASTCGHEHPLLPLWGQICCKLMAQPDCATEQRIAGFINLQVRGYIRLSVIMTSVCVCVCAAYGGWSPGLDKAVVCLATESSEVLEEPGGRG